MRRRTVYAALLLIAVVLATCLYLTRDPVNEANFDSLAVGMSLEEVHATFGRAPDSETTEHIHRRGRPHPDEFLIQQWTSTEVNVEGFFDSTKHVAYLSCEVFEPWYLRWLDAAKRGVGLKSSCNLKIIGAGGE